VTLAACLLVLVWLSLTAYALLAGADFGAGFWDLVAGDARHGRPRRSLIEHSIGPVWESNHVWLIYVLVVTWTAFPPLFAAIASTLYIPLSLIAFGIIARGSAFAFRKVVEEVWLQRLFGAAFALSSVLTPYFLGAAAGGVASGRVPPGVAHGNVFTSWANPTSTACGILGVGLCAYLSAIYLTAEARRGGHHDLAEYFRRQGLFTGVAMGVVSLASLAVVHGDAPDLYHSLTHRGLPLVISSMLMGAVSMVLLARRHYASVRVSAAAAVAAILWAWGYGRYPELLPGLNAGQAASAHATLQATALTSAVGLTILLPSLAWLFILFPRQQAARPGAPEADESTAG
jgi:cytochrome bd ubiquinol oxidase subunit II